FHFFLPSDKSRHTRIPSSRPYTYPSRTTALLNFNFNSRVDHTSSAHHLFPVCFTAMTALPFEYPLPRNTQFSSNTNGCATLIFGEFVHANFHSSFPLAASCPARPTPSKMSTCRVPCSSVSCGEQYAAWSLPADHAFFPVMRSYATTAPF